MEKIQFRESFVHEASAKRYFAAAETLDSRGGYAHSLTRPHLKHSGTRFNVFYPLPVFCDSRQNKIAHRLVEERVEEMCTTQDLGNIFNNGLTNFRHRVVHLSVTAHTVTWSGKWAVYVDAQEQGAFFSNLRLRMQIVDVP